MPDSLATAPHRPLAERSRTYAIPCPSPFRDRVTALAQGRGVSVADLARAILLTVPEAAIRAAADPGEPAGGDRETVALKSGASKGRVLRRKPRLQVRLQPGLDIALLRRALALALAMAEAPPAANPAPAPAPAREIASEAKREAERLAARIKNLEEELERLRLMLSAAAFEPLKEGVRSRADALHVLGFPSHATPDDRTLKAKFRMLAMIFHPDSPYGDTLRMGQLNAAMDALRR
ncbi:J domain-containing protein [Oceanibaculum pacificum]|uniref:J domain-containing protein n=1 Tax=Oceanibaculum pacificum TaxID=580166 RepID=A0A154WFN5_9PROT|nr:J domain-containing protein [Oceanibaculum pacificum]KZD12275.1 hypothetical protein AUP43_16890 [Oceanibaculum pacificum]